MDVDSLLYAAVVTTWSWFFQPQSPQGNTLRANDTCAHTRGALQEKDPKYKRTSPTPNSFIRELLATWPNFALQEDLFLFSWPETFPLPQGENCLYSKAVCSTTTLKKIIQAKMHTNMQKHNGQWSFNRENKQGKTDNFPICLLQTVSEGRGNSDELGRVFASRKLLFYEYNKWWVQTS